MQIGEVIRKYRKLKNMTQEEMANRLGVTAPAVNKWENGNSLPDITLLAPVARLLNITLDTLLAFQEELTEVEIKEIVIEANSMIQEKPYEEAFEWAKEKLEHYPNSHPLFLQIALIFDGWRLIKGIDWAEKYNSFISQWYDRALESSDEDIRTKAADALYGFYWRNEQYEKAEEYLTCFSDQNPEKKRKQAQLYGATNRRNKAYQIYEELLFSHYQMLSACFYGIYMLAMQDGNMEKARMLTEKQIELARLLERGEYAEASCGLDLAVAEKDVEATINIMEKMLSSFDTVCDFSKSSLYEHILFKETSEEFLAEVKNNLLQNFRDKETYGFLKDEERWKKIVK